MSQEYSNPSRESDPFALPDVEVFFLSDEEAKEDFDLDEGGWFYWYCFPGCLPDSEPFGPFHSHGTALQDAVDNGGFDE